MESMTYWLLAPEVGLVKIGKSTNPWHRMRRLRALNAARVECIVINRQSEPELHHKFVEHRSHGEWFRVHEDMVKHLEEIKEYSASFRMKQLLNKVDDE